MLRPKLAPTFLFYFLLSYSVLAVSDTFPPLDLSLYQGVDFPELGYRLYKESPEGGFKYFEDGATYFYAHNDTSSYLQCLFGLSDLERRQGQYNKSFDILWDILSTRKYSLTGSTLQHIHKRLGMLYGIYGKDSLSLAHLNLGLDITKQLVDKDQYLNTLYFALAEQNIKMEQYDVAQQYLDSCYLVSPSNNRLIYVDAYYGLVNIKKHDYRKAEIYLRGLITAFEQDTLAFKARVYTIHADLKMAYNQLDSAIFYLEKSLITIDSMKVYHEIKPIVLDQLAQLYFQLGKRTEAYVYMKSAKEVSDSLFNTQSRQNKILFEIKNRYKEDLTKQLELIDNQKNMLELRDKASFRLQLLIVILIIVVVIVLIFFRQKSNMKRIVYEQKINEEKNHEVLEVKKKELTVNALQFIEKENAINELLEVIKEISPERYSSIYGSYNLNNKKIWEDFHHRFTQTNNSFYEKLLKDYPTLTQTDLKHCALVKLNFDSKEMAQILGISLHSVHMARSRVRKKLNLQREDSLGGYLNAL